MTVSDKSFKKDITKWMAWLIRVRDYLIENNKSYEAQMYVKDEMKFEGYLTEIESPLVGGTDAEWIRLYYGDCYLFLLDNGEEWYQFDPYSEYGGEIIDERSYEDFTAKLNELKNIKQYYI